LADLHEQRDKLSAFAERLALHWHGRYARERPR
jgi:type II secretory pathway component PulM